MKEERLKYLFDRYCKRACTPGERQELAILCLLPENQAMVEKLVEDAWAQIPAGKDMPADRGAALLQEILQSSFPQAAPAKVRRISGRRWWAAASIILLLAAGAYFLFLNKPAQQHVLVTTTVPHDIKSPATNRAMVTLANGQTVYLDSAGNGTLAEQGNMKLVKMADGRIAYQMTDGSSSPLSPGRPARTDGSGGGARGEARDEAYNTLTNPRGSKVIDMTLSDGSHLWLNAGSSVTYPVAFTGNERKVSMTGEAYFEVAHNAAKPFKVSKGTTEVTVLGTHFNVNAYDDADALRVTLLEGSVRVAKDNYSVTIKPGGQAEIFHSAQNDKIHVTNDVDVEEVMAWKNGLFAFGGADIREVMRQLARWYDLDVSYAGAAPAGHFRGKIPKELSLSQVLNVLTTTRIHYKLEGHNKIIIMPD